MDTNDPNNKKSTPDKYADHCKLDFSKCANDYVIDANARGKVQDITKDGKLVLSEPKLVQ